MKKMILLFLFPLLGLAQNNKLDKKSGFANYFFGTSPNEYKNLMLELEEGNSTLYSLEQSPIRIDGIEFEYVRVTFYHNKLSVISLRTKNSMGAKFLQAIKENYGEPTKSNSKNETYEWNSNKIQLVFANNVFNKDAVIDFYYKETSKNN